jgi:hypothetical protein
MRHGGGGAGGLGGRGGGGFGFDDASVTMRLSCALSPAVARTPKTALAASQSPTDLPSNATR